MERWQENRTQALEMLTSLDPAAYQARYQQLLRGGLSADSIPEGSRSSDKPLPGFDNQDVILQRDHRGYGQDIDELLIVLRRLGARENAMLLVMGVSIPPRDDPKWQKQMLDACSKATEELVDIEQGEHRFVCRNCGKTFKRTASQRPRAGRCRACNDYWVAHGRTEDAPIEVTERRTMKA